MARASKKDPPAIQQLGRLRAQILQLAVQGKLVPQVASDEPASVLLERIAAEREQLVKSKQIKKPKPLPPIGPEELPYTLPQGWEWARVGAITESLDQGWSPQCENRPSASNEEWGVIKTTAIQATWFDPSENKALPATMEPRPKLELRVGDLLITRAGPRTRCGICCYVAQTRPRLMNCDKAYRFRVAIDGAYAGLSINAPTSMQAIEVMKTGGSESGLNLTQSRFAELPLPVPPLDEQQRIVAKVDELMAAIDELESYLRRVEALRPQILQLAVQGKLVPQNSSDEPASMLLERIAAEREQLIKTKQIKKPKPLPPIDPDELPYQLPQGWEWARLGDMWLTADSGFACSKTHEDPDGTVHLRTHNVASNGTLSTEVLTRIATAEVDPRKVGLVRGNVLFNNTNSAELVGKTAFIDRDLAWAYSNHMTRLSFSEVDFGRFLALSLHATQQSGHFAQICNKWVGQAGVNATVLGMHPVAIPPFAEQQRIIAKADELMVAIDAVQGRATAHGVAVDSQSSGADGDELSLEAHHEFATT